MIESVSSGVQSWRPAVRNDGVKGDDAGERSMAGRLPKSGTQDSLAGSIAALLRPG
jgi:hypothetical protein